MQLNRHDVNKKMTSYYYGNIKKYNFKGIASEEWNIMHANSNEF